MTLILSISRRIFFQRLIRKSLKLGWEYVEYFDVRGKSYKFSLIDDNSRVTSSKKTSEHRNDSTFWRFLRRNAKHWVKSRRFIYKTSNILRVKYDCIYNKKSRDVSTKMIYVEVTKGKNDENFDDRRRPNVEYPITWSTINFLFSRCLPVRRSKMLSSF